MSKTFRTKYTQQLSSVFKESGLDSATLKWGEEEEEGALNKYQQEGASAEGDDSMGEEEEQINDLVGDSDDNDDNDSSNPTSPSPSTSRGEKSKSDSYLRVQGMLSGGKNRKQGRGKGVKKLPTFLKTDLVNQVSFKLLETQLLTQFEQRKGGMTGAQVALNVSRHLKSHLSKVITHTQNLVCDVLNSMLAQSDLLWASILFNYCPNMLPELDTTAENFQQELFAAVEAIQLKHGFELK
jgi:hypothetical protein